MLRVRHGYARREAAFVTSDSQRLTLLFGVLP